MRKVRIEFKCLELPSGLFCEKDSGFCSVAFCSRYIYMPKKDSAVITLTSAKKLLLRSLISEKCLSYNIPVHRGRRPWEWELMSDSVCYRRHCDPDIPARLSRSFSHLSSRGEPGNDAPAITKKALNMHDLYIQADAQRSAAN